MSPRTRRLRVLERNYKERLSKHIDIPDFPTRRLERLFAVACCRSPAPYHYISRIQPVARAVDTAELFADGLIDLNKIQIAHEFIWWPSGSGTRTDHTGQKLSYCLTHAATSGRPLILLRNVFARLEQDEYLPPNKADNFREQVVSLITAFLRPGLTFDPRWRTPIVNDLAEAIYQEKAFDRTPVLADALEEQGCDKIDLLEYLRKDTIKARGCWVLDHCTGR